MEIWPGKMDLSGWYLFEFLIEVFRVRSHTCHPSSAAQHTLGHGHLDFSGWCIFLEVLVELFGV